MMAQFRNALHTNQGCDEELEEFAERTHLATDNDLVRNVLLALLSSLAKVEAQKIAQRTKAGMARANERN